MTSYQDMTKDQLIRIVENGGTIIAQAQEQLKEANRTIEGLHKDINGTEQELKYKHIDLLEREKQLRTARQEKHDKLAKDTEEQIKRRLAIIESEKNILIHLRTIDTLLKDRIFQELQKITSA